MMMAASHLIVVLLMVLFAISQSLVNGGKMVMHKRIFVSPYFKLQRTGLTASSTSPFALQMSDNEAEDDSSKAKIEAKVAPVDGKIIAAPGDESTAVEKKDDKGLFGLSITNPQDWITVILSSIIIYETFDLVVFWVQKLTGLGVPAST